MNDRSHISVILDRTGSMQDIRADVVDGYNAFLAAQKDTPYPATLTLVQFDSQDPYEVLHAAADIASVPPLALEQYVPRASTPLYDAMGRGILDLETWLAAKPDAERPSKVIFVVVTDGQENASREFDRARVNRLVEAKKRLGWDFMFLSADLGAFEDAGQIGVEFDSRLKFEKSSEGNNNAWAAASLKIRDRRTGVAAKVVFDDLDRELAERR
ncbi:VWA domain-containing protein [Pseudoxanthomonas suwonensis]|uniref:VWA domain-containing protein n=1 Tax=Pseudoxanthomonas suwonensis TaxID=314722 RepID=UPI0004B58897|nr:VWA domain-containing protein [Pseudoxanthomonas suwonensis]